MFVIALVGLSGVGKSTLLVELSSQFVFQHLAASELIKDEMVRLQSEVASSEELRLGPVLENQGLLVSAFQRLTQGVDGLVVLDGHTVIDGSVGLIEIPAQVFADTGARHMLFLRADASQILQRRRKDARRIRPERSVEEIEQQQERAIGVAKKIADQLEIPLDILQSGNTEDAQALFDRVIHRMTALGTAYCSPPGP